MCAYIIYTNIGHGLVNQSLLKKTQASRPCPRAEKNKSWESLWSTQGMEIRILGMDV